MGSGHILITKEVYKDADRRAKQALYGFLSRGVSERHVVDTRMNYIKLYLDHPDFTGDDESDRYTLNFHRTKEGDVHLGALIKDNTTVKEYCVCNKD